MEPEDKGMVIYIHKRLDRMFDKFGIGDIELCTVASEIMHGNFEADLGGGVKKKRIPLHAGKSGGVRSVVFFKREGNLFFYGGSTNGKRHMQRGKQK